MKKTYDVQFNDSIASDCKGFKESFKYCKNYIKMHNGTNHGYFSDYKTGTVSVVCNETEQRIFETEVK